MITDFCVICGTKENLDIHHIIPKNAPNNLRPIRGMDDPTNLITLCVEHHGWIHGCKPNKFNNHFLLMREGLKRARREGKVKAGIERAKREGKYTGRPPSIDNQKILDTLKAGNSISKTAEICGVSMSSVQRAKRKAGLTLVTQGYH